MPYNTSHVSVHNDVGCEWPKASKKLPHEAAAIIHEAIRYTDQPKPTLKRKAPFETATESQKA
jgi:hypothetical protein